MTGSAAPGGPPSILGVGEVAGKDPDAIVGPLDLVTTAARAALDDAGLSVDQLGGVYATPFTTTDEVDASEAVAGALGAPPGARGTSSYSGAGPQVLVSRAMEAVAAGAGPVLVVGGVAEASVARARRAGRAAPAPPTAPWSQGSARRPGPGRPTHHQPPMAEVAAGAGLPPSWFALVESALAAGDMGPAHRNRLGALLAPFSAVAATRPEVAWFPSPRPAAEIATPTSANRLVAEPYTKLMCSFPTVDLAAGVIVGPAPVGDHKAVRPLAITTATESGPPSTWARIDRFDALHRAVAAALDRAGLAADDLTAFDLYSCFPAAVQLAMDALGLDAADPRPRTLTGGLPFFGGPGASYSLHGLVATVEQLRAAPGSLAAVVGVGGMVTDAAVGIYGITDARPAAPTVDLGTGPAGVAVRAVADGPATVEASTVLHDRERGPVAAPVIARLPDGARIGARAGDPDLPAALSGLALVGSDVILATDAEGRVTFRLR